LIPVLSLVVATAETHSASRRRQSPSLVPALVVVGLAVLIVVGGTLLSLLGGSSAPTANAPATVPRGGLVGASPSLLSRRLVSDGEPPSDVVGALAVPLGSRYLHAATHGPLTYDRTVTFSVPAPSRAVRSFYVATLSARKWVLASMTKKPGGGFQLVADRNGSDGYGWQVGITIRPVGLLVSPALAGSGESAAQSRLTIELYQEAEAS
jgi:hypothetical protein